MKTLTPARLLVLVFALVAVVVPFEAQGDDRAPSGTYTDGAVCLTLDPAASGGGCTGSITKGGRTFPFKAKRVGSLLSGVFESGGHRFSFTARVDGKAIIFKTGKSTHRLTRKPANPFDAPAEPAAPTNPLDAPATPTFGTDETAPKTAGPSADAAAIDRRAKAAMARAEAGLVLDKTFRHPSGFYFCHPAAWALRQAGEGVLMLTPPDVKRTAKGGAELFLVIGDDADGVTRPDDPRAIRTADQIMKGLIPTLKRTGKVTTKKFAKYTGAAIMWAGTTPTGLKAKAKMWLTIIRGNALGMLMVTTEDRFERRARQADDLFSTFGFTKPKGDPRLVGHWRHDTSYISGTFTMATSTYLTLNADGTCRRGGTKAAGGMEHSDAGGNWTGSSTVGSGRGGYISGQWHSVGKQINLRWSNGTSERWEVLFGGDSMLFRRGKNTKKLWSRCR